VRQWVDFALLVLVPVDWTETGQGVETVDVLTTANRPRIGRKGGTAQSNLQSRLELVSRI
jgi:hypothetical protein